MAESKTLLEVRNLSTTFIGRGGAVNAVKNVSFGLERGEILGLVGESGSGKSVTARSIVNLVPHPGRITAGSVYFDGTNLLELSPAELRKLRGSAISYVMQEPMSSLNPVMRIGAQMAEVFTAHPSIAPVKRDVRSRLREVLDRVYISESGNRLDQYPMHLSGGMRQRVSIAIAVLGKPQLLIADEPTTALDVTVQAQVLDLLRDLRDEFAMGMILITHDLGVVAQMCDRVAVMYAGEIVELADVNDLFNRPQHPYTRALLKSLPNLDQRIPVLPSINGLPPDLSQPITGCSFAARCEEAMDKCDHDVPPLVQITSKSQSRCWLSKESQ